MTDKPKDLSGSFLQPHQRVLQSTVGCIVSPEMHARTHKGDLAKLGCTHLGFQPSDGRGRRIGSFRSISTVEFLGCIPAFKQMKERRENLSCNKYL